MPPPAQDSDDEELYESDDSVDSDPEDFIETFAGLTSYQLRHGQGRADWAEADKTTMFKHAVANAYCSKSLPSVSQLVDLCCTIGVPLDHGIRVAKNSVEKVLSWIANNVNQNATTGLIMESCIGKLGTKLQYNVHVAEALVKAVYDPAFSFAVSIQGGQVMEQHVLARHKYKKIQHVSSGSRVRLIKHALSYLLRDVTKTPKRKVGAIKQHTHLHHPSPPHCDTGAYGPRAGPSEHSGMAPDSRGAWSWPPGAASIPTPAYRHSPYIDPQPQQTPNAPRYDSMPSASENNRGTYWTWPHQGNSVSTRACDRIPYIPYIDGKPQQAPHSLRQDIETRTSENNGGMTAGSSWHSPLKPASISTESHHRSPYVDTEPQQPPHTSPHDNELIHAHMQAKEQHCEISPSADQLEERRLRQSLTAFLPPEMIDSIVQQRRAGVLGPPATPSVSQRRLTRNVSTAASKPEPVQVSLQGTAVDGLQDLSIQDSINVRAEAPSKGSEGRHWARGLNLSSQHVYGPPPPPTDHGLPTPPTDPRTGNNLYHASINAPGFGEGKVPKSESATTSAARNDQPSSVDLDYTAAMKHLFHAFSQYANTPGPSIEHRGLPPSFPVVAQYEGTPSTPTPGLCTERRDLPPSFSVLAQYAGTPNTPTPDSATERRDVPPSFSAFAGYAGTPTPAPTKTQSQHTSGGSPAYKRRPPPPPPPPPTGPSFHAFAQHTR